MLIMYYLIHSSKIETLKLQQFLPHLQTPLHFQSRKKLSIAAALLDYIYSILPIERCLAQNLLYLRCWMPFQCLWTHTAAPRSHRRLWHDRSCHLEWPSPAGLHLTEPSQLIRAPPLPPLPASPALFLKAPFGQYYILWTIFPLASSFSNTLSPSIAMPTTHRLTCLSNPWINVPETTSGIVLLTSEWITTPYSLKLQ